MMTTTGDRTSMRHVTAVESVGILSLFILFTCRAQVIDPLRVWAVAELLLFARDVDANWETLWRSRATPEALLFDQQWRVTSPEKYSQWLATRDGATAPPPTMLSSTPRSSARVQAQAVEAITCHVLPDLDPVRPFNTDSKAGSESRARSEGEAG